MGNHVSDKTSPTVFTFLSDVISLKASVTCLDVAPAPTSRKLAGIPPCSFIMKGEGVGEPC